MTPWPRIHVLSASQKAVATGPVTGVLCDITSSGANRQRVRGLLAPARRTTGSPSTTTTRGWKSTEASLAGPARTDDASTANRMPLFPLDAPPANRTSLNRGCVVWKPWSAPAETSVTPWPRIQVRSASQNAEATGPVTGVRAGGSVVSSTVSAAGASFDNALRACGDATDGSALPTAAPRVFFSPARPTASTSRGGGALRASGFAACSGGHRLLNLSGSFAAAFFSRRREHLRHLVLLGFVSIDARRAARTVALAKIRTDGPLVFLGTAPPKAARTM